MKTVVYGTITVALAAANAWIWMNIIKQGVEDKDTAEKSRRNNEIMKHNNKCIKHGQFHEIKKLEL